MTKAEIVDLISEKAGFSRREAAEILEVVLELIKNSVARGEDVKISGFGKFAVRDKRARRGRNPQTGQALEITARRVLTFKPSPILRDALNEPAPAEAAAQPPVGSAPPSFSHDPSNSFS